ncbi:hypothetical protein KPL71_012021 [Citrus sinensis]|uniref:Uncharacterized protein n=1 Tax=Citrus sinensis TaxID=2711 RepID=A0ACB8L7Y2_CITSI|nr:hypothetical protein KPL71_012021 [Citrus sinensis]
MSSARGNKGRRVEGSAGEQSAIDRLTNIVARLLEREVRRDEHGQAMNNVGSEFRRLNPPTFKGSVDPIAADQWLQTMERMIEVAKVPEEEKVLIDSGATHSFASPVFIKKIKNVPGIINRPFSVMVPSGEILNSGQLVKACEVSINDFRRRENFSFMASTSSSTPSSPVTLSSTLSLPKSCTSHTANKIEHLVEYSYIPESAQISESSYPLISLYQLYKRPSSFTRSIRTLISTRRPHPKEYIQSSRLDQCSLQATPAEQYVTLEIPSELISNWKREGYTHLHLGGIRLILTLHGRKGLPVTTRLAMLDTRFKQYQDAVIGTVLTTLHAGSVLLTFYPNFNLSLQDPNLPTTLKVQIQIQGAEQISSAKIATLHHQLVYRLQNHALDLPTPEHHSDTLMVLVESDQIPTIIQIPRQIPRHELIKLMPLEWISNYEQFHNNTAPIQTSESMFERRQDGTVRMTFKPPPSAPQEPPRLSFTYSSMITAVQTAQEDLPITGFNSEGYPVYPAKHNGHFLWDAPGSGMYPPPPPAPLPIYRKELKWIAKHCKSEIPSPLPNPTPIVQPLACMMFSSTSSDYSSSFPSLEPHTDPQQNVVSKPFIPSPITSTGHLEPPKPFESVLNWQTQNARAQNDTLLNLNSKVENINLRTEQIETKVDSITAQMQQIYQNLQSIISQLDSELRAMLAHRYSGPEFDQKEREIRRLKAELAQIESEKQRPTLFTTSPPIPSIGPTYHHFTSMLSPIKPYDPSKLFGMTHTLFRDNPLPPPPKPKPKPRMQPRPAPLHPSSLTIPGQPSPTSAPTSPLAPFLVPTQSKDKEPMHQFTAHTVDHSSTTDNQTSDSNLAVSDSPTDTDTESLASTSDSEKSYADIPKILMAQPEQGQTSHTEPYVNIPSEVEEDIPESSATNQPSPAQTNPPSHKSSNGSWFTFDDLPSHKWRDRLNEMSAWIDLQMLKIVPTKEKNPSDEPNDETVFALHNSSNSDSDQSQVIFHQQLLSLDTTVPIPSIRLQILSSKFQRPIPAIGLIDTGAQRSMLNPHILPSEYWTQSEEHFKAVNGKLFTTSLITKKPIGIQIFPNYVIWTKVIGSTLPNKDILLGFDILYQIQHLEIIPTGIRVKSMFKPFTDILKLYNLSETPQSYQDISTKLLSFCPESHSEFTHPNPLWKNKSLFIKLPFKLNEDINPTKATHPGMSPSDLLLAQQECSQLLAQGLIEPTSSQWACQAFYVEKHSEIVRGKKRIVIDYQPLNMFLQYDKFPLPRRQSMFTFLKNAQIFSKFDLKSGSHDDHRQLLTQFYDLIQSHGIMLSAKKSTIATDNIEFLGMIIKDEHYQPGKHIAQELLHFPDQQLSKRQIQQFLGIINYIRDFIPHVDHYTHHLLALLKKKPPEWNANHTFAVTTLKQIAQNPPPLKLITDGKRIL